MPLSAAAYCSAKLCGSRQASKVTNGHSSHSRDQQLRCSHICVLWSAAAKRLDIVTAMPTCVCC